MKGGLDLSKDVMLVSVGQSSAWIKGGAGGACAPPESSGFSTKHSNVPPRKFEDYLEIQCL